MKGFFLKGIFVLAIFQLAFITGIVFGQHDFQGQVEAKFSYNGDDTNINYYAKDGMARVELEPSGKGMKSIFIVKNNILYMLSPNDKKYTETPIRAQNKLRNFMGDSLKEKVIKTEETKEILGYKTIKWIYQGRNNRVEVWNTNDLGNIIDTKELFGVKQNARPGWIRNLFSEGFFPLQAKQYDRNDKELRTFEVKKVEKKELSGDLFNIPDDYKKMNAGR